MRRCQRIARDSPAARERAPTEGLLLGEMRGEATPAAHSLIYIKA